MAERDHQPLVTVVVPMFNASATIGDTLASLAAQTEPRWDAVIVDDASSDGCGEIVAAAAERDRRVRPLRIAHAGEAGARNAGLDAAATPWVAFLDADDAYEPGALRVLLTAAAGSEGRCDGAVGGYLNCDAGLRAIERREPSLPAYGLEGMATGGMFAMGSWIVRAPAIAGLRFELGRRFCADTAFVHALGERGARFAATREAVMRRRIHAGNVSKRAIEHFAHAREVIEALFSRQRALPQPRRGLSDVSETALRSRLRALAVQHSARAGLISPDEPGAALGLLRAWIPTGARLAASEAAASGRAAAVLALGEPAESVSDRLLAWWSAVERAGMLDPGEAGRVVGLTMAVGDAGDRIADRLASRCVAHARLGGPVVVVGVGRNGRALVSRLIEAGVPAELRDDRLAGGAVDGWPVGPVAGVISDRALVVVTPLEDRDLLPRLRGGTRVRWLEAA